MLQFMAAQKRCCFYDTAAMNSMCKTEIYQKKAKMNFQFNGKSIFFHVKYLLAKHLNPQKDKIRNQTSRLFKKEKLRANIDYMQLTKMKMDGWTRPKKFKTLKIKKNIFLNFLSLSIPHPLIMSQTLLIEDKWIEMVIRTQQGNK